jgi:hypothetical protein
MTFDPSASSIASRSDPRPRVSRCDRRSVEQGDARCPGVFEPGLRSPPPHRWRATPRLTGLSGRCVCFRSGSLRRRSAPIALEPATTEGLFPSFRVGSRIHAMRANSGARRQVVRQQGRSVAKTREASPREATWCRDLVRQSRKAEAHESEERLQSSDTRGLSKGLEPPERRCPRPRRPLTFTRQGARVGLGRLRTKALEIARGPRADDDRHQRRYATRAVGKTTPRRRPDRESTEARTAT